MDREDFQSRLKRISEEQDEKFPDGFPSQTSQIPEQTVFERGIPQYIASRALFLLIGATIGLLYDVFYLSGYVDVSLLYKSPITIAFAVIFTVVAIIANIPSRHGHQYPESFWILIFIVIGKYIYSVLTWDVFLTLVVQALESV